jgi:uncharacterized RDD family membrane protein YckC
MQKAEPSRWMNRFYAWLIDILLVSLLWYLIAHAFSVSPQSLKGLGYESILIFVYWTALEGYRGQSLGKMILNLSVVGPAGEPIGFKNAAIESFGKAFLLPLDCLIGWLAFTKCGQRLFNRLSNSVVADIDEQECCCMQV